MTNFEKLTKLTRTTVPLTIEIEGQEVTLDIKKVDSQHANLLKFSSKDADKSIDELLKINKPLILYCADLTEEQFNELTFDVVWELFEGIMDILMPKGKKGNKEDLLEQARKLREQKQ